MKKIILNTKNVKDYKINPRRRFDSFVDDPLNDPLVDFRKLYDREDVLIDTICCNNSYIYRVPYTFIKVLPNEGVNFIPFCCCITYSYTLPFSKEHLFIDNDIIIPKQRNSVINGKPIIAYDDNWECRLNILREYFPMVFNKLDLFIEDPNIYSDHDYCLVLDETFNMITGETTGVPIPEPDIDFLIKHVHKIF